MYHLQYDQIWIFCTTESKNLDANIQINGAIYNWLLTKAL